MSLLHIYNQSIKIDCTNEKLQHNLLRFANKFYTQSASTFNVNSISGNGKDKVFIIISNNGKSFTLHRNQFKHFLSYAEQIGLSLADITKVDHRDYKIELIDAKIRPGWVLTPEQEGAVSFIVDEPKYSALIPMQTGKGKTVVATHAISIIGRRVAICILPMYIDKWISDLVELLDIKPTDIMVIRGSASLGGLIDLAKEGNLEAKFVIFSSTTLQNYLTSYNVDPEFTINKYGVEPPSLMPLLNIGVMLIDEAHQHYENMFKIIISSNVKQLIGLSATFIADDGIIKRMHNIVFPPENIYRAAAYDKYTDVYAISYSVNHNWKKLIRTNEYGSNVYSHSAYEKSITKNPQMKARYFALIKDTIETYYLDEYKSGDKLAVYVSTVKVADMLTNYLAHQYPNMSVRRYCEGDPYENVIEPDIRVTTVIKTGTAIDIKGLRTVILTISLSSPVSNLQVLGRLRKLPDRDVKFCYLYNDGLGKHIDYHYRKKELFRSKAKIILDRKSRVSV